MRATGVLLLMLCAFGATTDGRPGAPPFPPFPEDQRVLLHEALHLVRTLGPGVWPGFDGADAPVLMIVGEAEYLFHLDEAPAGFGPLRGEPFGGHPVFVRSRVLDPGLLASFPAVGREAVVVGTAERTGRSVAAWTLAVAHELFHVFQSHHGMNAKVAALGIGPEDQAEWHLSFPFPYEDPDVQRAMHLLGYSLFRSATLAPGTDASEVRYAVRVCEEALANLVRMLSLLRDDPRHADYLRYQVAKEGVARYVEYRLAERAASDGYRPVPRFRQLAGPGRYAEVWERQYRLNHLNQLKHAGSVSRNRLEFYGLGLGLGLTLDRIDPTWKRRYFRPGIWADQLLQGAVRPALPQNARDPLE